MSRLEFPSSEFYTVILTSDILEDIFIYNGHADRRTFETELTRHYVIKMWMKTTQQDLESLNLSLNS